MVRRMQRKVAAGDGRRLSVVGLVVLELATIVLAVVLGFMVNEWREARVSRRQAADALATLAREVTLNHQALERSFVYYRGIREGIEEVAPGDRRTTYGFQLAGWEGARLPMLRSSTFDMLVSTGRIGDLPFEQAEALTGVYTLQGFFSELDRAFLERIANDPGFSNLETIRHAFDLYLELTPSLIALYHEEARPVLGSHGFVVEVADPALRATVEAHRADYRRQMAEVRATGAPTDR